MRISSSAIVLILPYLFVGPVLGQGGTAGYGRGHRQASQDLVAALAGSWKLELYQRGDSSPVLVGRRDMRLLQDSTKLLWTEVLRGRADTGSGVLGYNPTNRSYYLLGAYTHEADPIVLWGRADTSARSITFEPASSDAVVVNRPGVFVSSQLRVIDANHFEWVAADGQWRAVFTRI
jgi:hypothetical protein